jgi:hypothetical protein
MSVTSENASLILNTKFKSVTTNNNTKNTWYNINLKSLLQGMYDKYDSFNLCLNTISTGVSSSNAGTNAQDKNVIVYISGLPFISQGYNSNTQTIKSETVIGSFTFPTNTTNTTATQYFYSSNICTFNKTCDMLNITIELRTVGDDGTPVTVNTYPDQVYIFDIYGVEPNNKLISNRIKGL